MRILLISPLCPSLLQRHRLGGGYLGLAYVAAALKQQGHEVRVIDAKIERLGLREIVARVEEFQPRMVGSTAMTHEICYVAEVLGAVREACDGCTTVVGGPHGSALPERTLDEFPAIDVVVVGEGEETAPELAAAIESGVDRSEWRSIRGIAFRDKLAIQRTEPRPWITNLDALPMPAWELYPREVYWPIITARGCPFRCAFCQRVLGSELRPRSVDSVLSEVHALASRTGQRGCRFQDDTFGIDHHWTAEFLARLAERNWQRGYTWRWACNSRINLADADLYRRMKQAGCHKIDFGIESGDQEVLERIHKGIKLDDVREAVRCVKQAGLQTEGFFILGHPGETWKSALRTIRFAPQSGVDSIALGIMVPYPGTEVWELARHGEQGYRLLTEDWRAYDKYFGSALELRGLSLRSLQFLQGLGYVWFFLRRRRLAGLLRLVRRFPREALTLLGRILRIPGT